MKKFPIVLLTALIVGAPLGYLAYNESHDLDTLHTQADDLQKQVDDSKQLTASADPLFYDMSALDVTLSKKQLAFSDLFTADSLTTNASDCGTTVADDYFTKLIADFEGQNGYEYDFTSNSDAGETYKVMLFPNAPAYTTFTAFKNDFQACAAGQTQPARLSSKWLMFTGACGAAYGTDTPTLSCSDIQKGLTLEFN